MLVLLQLTIVARFTAAISKQLPAPLRPVQGSVGSGLTAQRAANSIIIPHISATPLPPVSLSLFCLNTQWETALTLKQIPPLKIFVVNCCPFSRNLARIF
jgi:hypothetical protein